MRFHLISVGTSSRLSASSWRKWRAEINFRDTGSLFLSRAIKFSFLFLWYCRWFPDNMAWIQMHRNSESQMMRLGFRIRHDDVEHYLFLRGITFFLHSSCARNAFAAQMMIKIISFKQINYLKALKWQKSSCMRECIGKIKARQRFSKTGNTDVTMNGTSMNHGRRDKEKIAFGNYRFRETCLV